MATTPELGMRYPDGGDNVDIPTSIEELALDVEATLTSLYIPTDGGAMTGRLSFPYGKDGGLSFGGSGPQVMSGTGSPYDASNYIDMEGLPIGSVWIQTDWQPIKASSTLKRPVVWNKTAANNSDYNGWSVINGDTGPRDLAGAMTWGTGGMNLGTYMDMSTPFTTAVLRRVDNNITLYFSGCNFSSSPSGWNEFIGLKNDDTSLGYHETYSWGLNANDAIYGMCITDSSGAVKPIRARRYSGYTMFEIYGPSGSSTYTGSLTYPAKQSQWPTKNWNGSVSVVGYLGYDPGSEDFMV